MCRVRAAGLTVLGLTLCLGASGAAAEPVTLDAILTTSDSISLGFKDDQRHFLTLILREGSATGRGLFEGAKVVEYGMHDVTNGDSGTASGYLEVTTTGGDIAYFRWSLRAFFVAEPDGKTRLINNGHWELAGGTGQFAAMRGVGTMLIEFVNKTDRRYLLDGDIAPAP